ncbi:AAC(3)-I family aminoglycoside N-acetyltransferase [Leptospira ognonensis]|uniref:AAC(3)-I family aminoglycoside N-acetyltransferase n=1 Tax=Leptospira ognonensis TaxID=2484945 RepID=A0A4R9K106_9LEPT|nr:AAC(3)-I family aminoglycoside N-acetyltransferase [Leptospira ognonensis]TGL57856.1 AAC(3)-I family aminoglycoside N-acetyltransferase [Leptospira ognonensis]
MLIQRLTKTDIDKMRKLNEVFAIAFEDTETHLQKLPKDTYLQSLLEKSHFIALTAMLEEEVVGGLVAYILEKYEQERSEIYIYDLAVAERFRRQGIARSLILNLKEMAREMGAYVIFVQADRQDEPAILLYRSLGIQEEPFHFDILP